MACVDCPLPQDCCCTLAAGWVAVLCETAAPELLLLLLVEATGALRPCRLLTADRFLMPITKHRESRMLDLPLPLSPVMALKPGSKFVRQTRCAYDLKPSMLTSLMYMVLPAQQRACCWDMKYRRQLYYVMEPRRLPAAAQEGQEARPTAAAADVDERPRVCDVTFAVLIDELGVDM